MRRRTLIGSAGLIVSGGCIEMPESGGADPVTLTESETTTEREGIPVAVLNRREVAEQVSVRVTQVESEQVLLDKTVTVAALGEDGDVWRKPDVLEEGSRNKVRATVIGGETAKEIFKTGADSEGSFSVLIILDDGDHQTEPITISHSDG